MLNDEYLRVKAGQRHDWCAIIHCTLPDRMLQHSQYKVIIMHA